MRKLISILLLMAMCQVGMAQTAARVFDKYRDAKNAKYTSIPTVFQSLVPSILSNIDWLADDESGTETMQSQVKGMRFILLDDCKRRVKRGFAKQIDALVHQGYDELICVRDPKEQKMILVKRDEYVIYEVVALIADKDNCIGMLFTGRINSNILPDLITALSKQ